MQLFNGNRRIVQFDTYIYYYFYYGYMTRNVCTEAIFVDDEYVEFDQDINALQHCKR